MKNAKSVSMLPDCPVSKKFYQETVSRIHASFQAIGGSAADELAEKTVKAVNDYLSGACLPADDSDATVRLMFALIRSELDKAMVRSAAARRRKKTAPRRPRRKSAGKNVPEESLCEPKASGSGIDMARLAELLKIREQFDCDDEDNYDEADEPAEPILLNRRQRRMIEREQRRKARREASRRR
ncbi:hypothetical protein [Duncaniella muris]|uniref:hypothetical protein n=1 Tax=Duncaniella muris TaxID=2094150 RepID=UPI00259ABB42|nr:hypothetical protein [Duncaniella muris]